MRIYEINSTLRIHRYLAPGYKMLSPVLPGDRGFPTPDNFIRGGKTPAYMRKWSDFHLWMLTPYVDDVISCKPFQSKWSVGPCIQPGFNAKISIFTSRVCLFVCFVWFCRYFPIPTCTYCFSNESSQCCLGVWTASLYPAYIIFKSYNVTVYLDVIDELLMGCSAFVTHRRINGNTVGQYSIFIDLACTERCL
jgi:hypothetical protein